MKIVVSDNLEIKQEVLALGLFEDYKDYYSKFNKELSEELKDAIDKKTFEMDFGKTYSTKIPNSSYKRVLVISLGKKNELTVDRIRRVMSKIIGYLRAAKLTKFTTNIPHMISETKKLDDSDIGMATSEGLVLSSYVFDRYKSKKDNNDFFGIIKSALDKTKFQDGINKGTIIADATNYAKDLVNEPSIVVTPEFIEKEAKKLVGPKIKVKVMDKKELEQKGLNAFLAVSLGSDHPPKLIFIEYSGGGPKDKFTAIIGKGITFDSGGYDIKPSGAMDDMKCDMSGAAAVLGTIIASSALGLKRNILGVIPTCENLINGSAYKPGDIIKVYNGKTVEIKNTDAEGRLILADALSFTEKNYSPEKMIDLATLTGGAIVALGYYASAIMGNNDALSKELIDAGDKSFDRLWPLPMFEEYMDNMDGDISDLANMATKNKDRTASAITGAVFLSKFVEKAAWAHIDIAGPAYLAEARDYNQKYASGCGVRLLTYYFMK